MIITPSIPEIRAQRWQNPTATWGLVPTMGFLHAGHLALVRQARAENDRVAVSIFVNPTQFGSNLDLETYPRDLDRDTGLLEELGVDLVFTPTNEIMYPAGFQTEVHLGAVTSPLEGAARPGHFVGVATVVSKLFNIVQPTRAYFGQKDAQQVAVIRRLVADLNFNLALVVGATVREADGLALSSRNVRLTPAQRTAAPVLHQALQAAAAAYAGGERDAGRLRAMMTESIAAEPLARIDYVSVADRDNLAELDTIRDGALLSLAVFFGEVRLIDNLVLA